jgi:hypothetical protein
VAGTLDDPGDPPSIRSAPSKILRVRRRNGRRPEYCREVAANPWQPHRGGTSPGAPCDQSAVWSVTWQALSCPSLIGTSLRLKTVRSSASSVVRKTHLTRRPNGKTLDGRWSACSRYRPFSPQSAGPLGFEILTKRLRVLVADMARTSIHIAVPLRKAWLSRSNDHHSRSKQAEKWKHAP